MEGQVWDQAMSSSSENDEDIEKTPDSDSLLACCTTNAPLTSGEHNNDRTVGSGGLGDYPDTSALPEVASGRVGCTAG